MTDCTFQQEARLEAASTKLEWFETSGLLMREHTVMNSPALRGTRATSPSGSPERTARRHLRQGGPCRGRPTSPDELLAGAAGGAGLGG